MSFCIKEVQEKRSGSWEIRIDRSDGEDIVGPIYSQNMPCLLTALDLKEPEDLVGISNESSNIKLSVANTFSKLLISFPVEGFYGSEKPNRSKRVSLVGAVQYTTDSVTLTFQPNTGNTAYYYYVKGQALQKLEKVFRVASALLLIHKREAKFKVTADGQLFATYTVSLPTPSALN